MKIFFRKWLTKIIAFLLLAALYSLSNEPKLATTEREKLVSEFSFQATKLYEPLGEEAGSIRIVNPQYKHLDAWISSVGAAVTLADLDGNGLCNDIIHVDPRFSKVLISSVEGTPSTIRNYELSPSQLPYDSLTTAPMGSLAYDFNNDGQTDILIYYWGRSPIIFLKTDNGFKEMELNSKVERWFSNAAILGDFDGDGNIDILITNYFPDGSKVLDINAKDKDQVMQHSMSRAYNGGDNHFFLYSKSTNKSPLYVEHTEWRNDVDHPQDWTLAVAAADLDGDLLPEIYFANDFGPDKLLYNISTPGKLHFKQLKGVRRFTDIRSSVLGEDSFKGMGVSFGDINNDGLLDIYVSNIAAKFALEESHFVFINTGKFDKMKDGIAPFVNESEDLGLSRSSWGWDCKLADFNNDGQVEAIQATGFVKGTDDKWAELQELAMGNDELLSKTGFWPNFTKGTEISGHGHNPFFVKSKSGRFFDIAKDLGLNLSNVSRGIAIGDVDHDGRLDFITANQWESSYSFKNTSKGNNNFIGLSIKFSTEKNTGSSPIFKSASSSNTKFAIGATVELLKADGTVVPSFVDGGNGHSGKNSNEVFFGTGNLKKNIKIRIKWRNNEGAVQEKIFQFDSGWHTIILS